MLNIKGITKSFNGLAVLENICCFVKENEIAALIGPSGCGKSTLLNIISKLETPDSGIIEGLGESVACVFQDNRLLPVADGLGKYKPCKGNGRGRKHSIFDRNGRFKRF